MGKILVVDDEEIMRSFLADVLRDEGYEVDIAENGEQGIEKIKEGQFHLVVTDVKMPGATGLELLVKVRSSWPDVLRAAPFALLKQAEGGGISDHCRCSS